MKKVTNRRQTPITEEDVQRGRRIRAARQAKGWSQIRLANELGTSQASISNLENGVTKEPRDFAAAELVLGLSHTPKIVPVPTSDSQRRVPLYEILLTETGVATMSNVAIETIPSPSSLSSIPEAYAFLMFSDDMRPRYRPGELLVIHPRTPARLEDGVVLRRKNGQTIVREFIKSNPTEWIVRRYGDQPGEEKWPRAEWPVCHVIWEVQRR